MPRRYRRPFWPQFDVPADIDSRSVRQSLGLTQAHFAKMLGVSVRVVEGWERRRWAFAKPGENTDNWGGGIWKDRQCRPTGAARVLLAMVARDPWVIYDCLSGQLNAKRGQMKPQLFD